MISRSSNPDAEEDSVLRSRTDSSVWSVSVALNYAVKALLVGLLLFAVLNPDMQQFQGKAMSGRALTYPIAIVIVPIAFWLIRRTHPKIEYPHTLDMLLGLPFLIDTAGNALDLYDTINWWDDLNHFVNWGILTAAFGQLLLRFPYGKWTMAGLAVGFGGVAGIVWEIAEYFTFVRGGSEEATAYTDTLGDLALDLGGAVIAALITAWVLRPDSGAAVGSEDRHDLSVLRQSA
jgi:hypothetical protein